MASIWKQNRDVTNEVNRNNFDLTKQSHCTFKFGYLYPVYCKPVYPTDAFRIRAAFDLKMMPMMFPLQSRVRANLHFFYVRNKNLWTGWEDFISGLKSPANHPHPYIRVTDDKVETGGIHDFLGVPTTVVNDGKQTLYMPLEGYNIYKDNLVHPIPTSLDPGHFNNLTFAEVINTGSPTFAMFMMKLSYSLAIDEYDQATILMPQPFVRYNTDIAVSLWNTNGSNEYDDWDYLGEVDGASYDGGNRYSLLGDFARTINNKLAQLGENLRLVLWFSDPSLIDFTNATIGQYKTPATMVQFTGQSASGVFDYDKLGLGYYSNVQYLNALPYRAYQSIYYGYYANDVLQPLVINGEKEYNKFIVNDGDGLDTEDYHLYRRNYELDFLTSAMPSPQAGPAPLVGISALGSVTITDANGVSTGQAETDSQGNITKIVATSPLASVNHARTMMNIAALGFNINDLRSANALQRMAEQTLRSGYRYINWVKGQFGRSPEYRELDMPEFIGGFSRDVQIGTVISQADTTNGENGKNLGDYGANGRVVGGSEHDIIHYCDDYGFIIGIMSITPTPAYSQLLPKHMIAPTNPLDYANPFLNEIGMQPITYREVCPLQAYMDSLADSTKSVDDTFGYQRPNYYDVGDVDEIHGEFRRTLKDYLINRQFSHRPELGTEFLEVNPSEINDIFINQNPDDDVFIGNLLFQVNPKRPFPRVHIARLK